MGINSATSIEPLLEEETPFDNFVKFTENNRRDRHRRLDAGDETAALNFPKQAQPPRHPPKHWQQARSAPRQTHWGSQPQAQSVASRYSGNQAGHGGNGISSRSSGQHSHRIGPAASQVGPR